MVWIGYRLRKFSNGRVVQVICQGDAMTFRHLEDFVLAISVESRPLDGLLAGMAPCEIDCFAAVLDA